MLTLASMLLLPKAVGAVSFETLVMPGPVVAAHADIEKDCRKCHEPFRKVRLLLQKHQVEIRFDSTNLSDRRQHEQLFDVFPC